MEKYILVSYEICGKTGKIIVKDTLTDKEIKKICALDMLDKTNKINNVNFIKR